MRTNNLIVILEIHETKAYVRHEATRLNVPIRLHFQPPRDRSKHNVLTLHLDQLARDVRLQPIDIKLPPLVALRGQRKVLAHVTPRLALQRTARVVPRERLDAEAVWRVETLCDELAADRDDGGVLVERRGRQRVLRRVAVDLNVTGVRVVQQAAQGRGGHVLDLHATFARLAEGAGEHGVEELTAGGEDGAVAGELVRAYAQQHVCVGRLQAEGVEPTHEVRRVSSISERVTLWTGRLACGRLELGSGCQVWSRGLIVGFKHDHTIIHLVNGKWC